MKVEFLEWKCKSYNVIRDDKDDTIKTIQYYEKKLEFYLFCRSPIHKNNDNICQYGKTDKNLKEIFNKRLVMIVAFVIWVFSRIIIIKFSLYIYIADYFQLYILFYDYYFLHLRKLKKI